MKDFRVIAETWSETVAPDLGLDRAMTDGVAALTIGGAGLVEK